jgi:hypothetical protein
MAYQYHFEISWLEEFPFKHWSINMQFYHKNACEYIQDLGDYFDEIANTENTNISLGSIPLTINNKDMAMQFKLCWS